MTLDIRMHVPTDRDPQNPGEGSELVLDLPGSALIDAFAEAADEPLRTRGEFELDGQTYAVYLSGKPFALALATGPMLDRFTIGRDERYARFGIATYEVPADPHYIGLIQRPEPAAVRRRVTAVRDRFRDVLVDQGWI